MRQNDCAENYYDGKAGQWDAQRLNLIRGTVQRKQHHTSERHRARPQRQPDTDSSKLSRAGRNSKFCHSYYSGYPTAEIAAVAVPIAMVTSDNPFLASTLRRAPRPVLYLRHAL